MPPKYLKVATADAECQTEVRCTRNIHKKFTLSDIIRDGETQTCISAKPCISITKLVPYLEYVEEKYIDCSKIIQVGDKAMPDCDPPSTKPKKRKLRRH